MLLNMLLIFRKPFSHQKDLSLLFLIISTFMLTTITTCDAIETLEATPTTFNVQNSYYSEGGFKSTLLTRERTNFHDVIVKNINKFKQNVYDKDNCGKTSMRISQHGDFFCSNFNRTNSDILMNASYVLSRKRRMAGGKKILDGALFPSFAKLVCYDTASNKSRPFICAGTLISDTLIITAAHCVSKMKACSVTLGSSPETEVKRFVWGYCVLPNYVRKAQYLGDYYDVAILQLYSPIDFNKNVQPACFDFDKKHYENAMNCYGVGYGTDNTKSPYERYFGKLQRGCGGLKPAVIDEVSRTCYLFEENVNLCNGDSGAGLYCLDYCPGYRRPKQYVVGVAQYTSLECNSRKRYNMYSDFTTMVPELKVMAKYCYEYHR